MQQGFWKTQLLFYHRFITQFYPSNSISNHNNSNDNMERYPEVELQIMQPCSWLCFVQENEKFIPAFHRFRFQVSANTSFGCTLSTNYSSVGNILELFKLLF